ncbi:MAG: ATP synthase subunit I [Desulfovibrionales bacterium]
MIRVLESIDRRIESGLYRKGFENPVMRKLVRLQLYLGVVGSAAAMIVSPGEWGPAFLAGAVLATLNFYSLARLIQQLVFVRKGAVLVLLISFYGRLILTGVLLFVLIAWVHASAMGLLAGLTTVVVTILMWGVLFVLGKE